MKVTASKAKLLTTRVYVVEEQEVYREAYKGALMARPYFELLGISGREGVNSISQIISVFSPDVLLIGVKTLHSEFVQDLIKIRRGNPHLGILLLAMSYSIKEMELLHNSHSASKKGGIAFFSKKSLDEIDQLCNILVGVSQGQLILDRMVTSVFARDSKCACLKELTVRELEILSLLSMGYSNIAIAESLRIDVKTVKHHINNMYGKLEVGSDLNGRHPRVSAARLYLEGNGFGENSMVVRDREAVF